MKLSSLARSTLMLTAVGLVSQGMGFFYRVMLSRLIGAETMGLYQLIMPVYAVIMSVTVSGLTVSLSTLSAGYHADGNQKAVSQLLFHALRTLFVLWMPIALAVCLLSGPLSARVLGDGRTRLGLLLLLPVLLLTGVENLHKHHFYGIGETALPAAVEMMEQFIRTAAILGLLVLLLPLPQEHAVAVIVLGMLVSEVFSSCALTAARLRREGRFRNQHGVPERSVVIRQQISAVAVPVSLAALLNNLISSANSVLIPQKLFAYGIPAKEAMELYGVIFGMTLPLLTIPFAFVNALCLALLPELTRSAALGQRQKLRQNAASALSAASLLVLPMLALIVPLGADIGKQLFRESRVGLYMLPLAVSVALSVYESILASILNGVRKQAVSASVSLICGLIQLCFTLFGVERFGFSACVCGMILSSGVGLILRLVAANRAAGLRLDYFRIFTAPLLGALLSGLWVNLFYQLLQRSNIPFPLLLTLCAGLGLILNLLVLLALDVFPVSMRKPFPQL